MAIFCLLMSLLYIPRNKLRNYFNYILFKTDNLKNNDAIYNQSLRQKIDRILDNIIDPRVTYKSSTIKKEKGLPMPFVLYPSFYGAFFAFSNSRDLNQGNVFLCSCSKKAVRIFFEKRYEVKRKNKFLETNKEFPLFITKHLRKIISNPQNKITAKFLLSNLNFQNNLCHICNEVKPSFEYSYPIYSEDSFDRIYGWYEKQKLYENGIYCNPLTKLIKFSNVYVPEYTLYKIEQIKNNFREELGYPKMGEKYKIETSIYYKIKNMFPNYIVRHNRRLQELENLELDIFIEESRIGIEYQGKSHYEPIYGEENLKQRQEYDEIKKGLCIRYGIRLVEIKYNEPRKEYHIKKKLKGYLN